MEDSQLVFDDCELDIDRFQLRRAGALVHVEAQVFDVLLYLVRHRERVVSKTELLDGVWGDRFVSETALTSRVKAARRAVGDDGTAQRVIRTIHGRGYQFVASVDERRAQAAPKLASELDQEVRFCVAPDGVRIAYATIGAGPPLVLVVHARGDLRVPLSCARELAALIPGSRLVTLDSRNHILTEREPAWDVFLRELDRFLADT